MSRSKYYYKIILYNFHENRQYYSIKKEQVYSHVSIEFLLQQCFFVFLEEYNIDFFKNFDLFYEKLQSIEFQKQLYFIVNYVENKNDTSFILYPLNLSEMNSTDWYFN